MIVFRPKLQSSLLEALRELRNVHLEALQSTDEAVQCEARVKLTRLEALIEEIQGENQDR